MKSLSIVFFLLFTAVFANCQYKIKVREENEKIADGKNNSLVVSIFCTTTGEIEKSWKKLMKDYGAKVSMKKEIFADDAIITQISANTMDIYAFTRKISDDEYELVCAVDLGGAFLSSSEHGMKYRIIQDILDKFARQVTSDGIDIKTKTAEKLYNDILKEKEKIVSDNEKLASQIEDYKKRISENESNIEKNKSLITEKEKEIEQQAKTVEEIKSAKNKIQ